MLVTSFKILTPNTATEVWEFEAFIYEWVQDLGLGYFIYKIRMMIDSISKRIWGLNE